MNLFDTHAHLDDSRLQPDLDGVLKRARDVGVRRFLSITSEATESGFMAPVEIARSHEDIWAAVGIHPHEAIKGTPELLKRCEEICEKSPEVKAVGEVGLDYHYDFSPRPKQREVFVKMLHMARRLALPVVLHVREAHEDALNILKREANGAPWQGVVHCFSEGPERAQAYLALGLHLSFTGVLTFKKAQAVKEAAKKAPRDRVFIETDSPYLAPVPHRGKTCEPAFVSHTNEQLAFLWGVSPQESARITTENACALFQIP